MAILAMTTHCDTWPAHQDDLWLPHASVTLVMPKYRHMPTFWRISSTRAAILTSSKLIQLIIS